MSLTSNIQPAGVAGLFYPAEPEALAAEVDASLARANPPELAAKAVVAPHAGHIYSGDIAGAAYKLLARRRGQIKRAILLGPTHRMPVRGMAVTAADAWATPLGAVRVAGEARDALAQRPDVTVAAEPFEGEHSLEVHLPFIQRALGDVEVLPVLVGNSPAANTSSMLAQLWGGPETAIIVSSDLSHFHDYATAVARDAETTAAIERLDFGACEGERACGCFPLAGLIDQAQRRDLRVTALDVRNSGDTQGDKSRVVGYGAFAFEYAHGARIPERQRRTLLDLAKEVVRQGIRLGGAAPKLRLEGGMPRPLLAQRASFVTLKIAGQLRGCRGTILPAHALIHDVAQNAWNSAFGDPRFAAVTEAEAAQLSFDISILSTPRRIPCASEAELIAALSPDIDGLIIRDGGRQSLFLPSVWAEVPHAMRFVRQLKIKAGLRPDHWSSSLEAFRFTTESFGDT
ncbi:MAG TPA: AmmeMemoRadiSam system protein B [Caulobacteraceae bacterium]|nr:AmmeMemoRadiSam system protein B [Caulobacteraceae bacterium]